MEQDDIQEILAEHKTTILAGIGGFIAGAVVGIGALKFWESRQSVTIDDLNDAQEPLRIVSSSMRREMNRVAEETLEDAMRHSPVERIVRPFEDESEMEDEEPDLEAMEEHPFVDHPPKEGLQDEPKKTFNIFEQSQEPYAITEEQFYDSDTGYSQRSFTYFEDDDVLCDEADVPQYNAKELVGPYQFGEGTKDEDTFYVRNDKTKTEYEIVRDRNSYAEMVLNIIDGGANDQKKPDLKFKME